MSSSSSSGASAAAAFTPVSHHQQQQQQRAAENLSSALQLPAPAQEHVPSDAEQLCYVHCHICDTVLVVSVPSSSLFKTVTVRCGHCSSLLTVDMRGLLIPTTTTTAAAAAAAMSANSAVTTSTTTSPPPPPAAAAQHGQQFHYPNSLNIMPPRQSLLDEISSANPSLQLLEQHGLGGLIAAAGGRNATAPAPPAVAGRGVKEPSPRTNSVVNRPPEKRQRVPSAYNRFIKDEIQRIKAGNPDISHREAFSAAAKNWAHFPHIHFGLMPDHQGLRKTTSLLSQDHQRKDGHGLLKEGLYAAAAAANMGFAPY